MQKWIMLERDSLRSRAIRGLHQFDVKYVCAHGDLGVGNPLNRIIVWRMMGREPIGGEYPYQMLGKNLICLVDTR